MIFCLTALELAFLKDCKDENEQRMSLDFFSAVEKLKY